MRWTLSLIIVIVFVVLYVLARRHERKARAKWIAERAAERDWKALEHIRWHTPEGTLLLAPRPLPDPYEREYRAALRSGEHTEIADHRRS